MQKKKQSRSSGDRGAASRRRVASDGRTNASAGGGDSRAPGALRASGMLRQSGATDASGHDGRERLQKIMAAAGIAARRTCEEMILDGRVTVNGQRVHTLPVLVDPATDVIKVDGRALRPRRKVYYILNKPRGLICTNHDPDNRRRAIDCLAAVKERVFPVGRLDADSTGLLLMTNDGELSEHLTHPRYGVAKTYRAEVAGLIDATVIEQLKAGVWLAEGKAHASDAKIIHRDRANSVIEVTLREGRNREVRRLLAKTGHKVRRLKRIAIGSIQLGSMPPGAYRPLKPAEVKRLWLDGAPEGHPHHEGAGKPRRGPATSATSRRGTARAAEARGAAGKGHGQAGKGRGGSAKGDSAPNGSKMGDAAGQGGHSKSPRRRVLKES